MTEPPLTDPSCKQVAPQVSGRARLPERLAPHRIVLAAIGLAIVWLCVT